VAADLKRSQAAIVEARQVFTAEKNLLYRREQMAFTEIRSLRRTHHPPRPGSWRRGRAGWFLLQLIATNEIWISAWVDETAISSLPRTSGARGLPLESAKSYTGEIARLGREADRGTREFWWT
jgi:HlyD family secretion protein